MLNVCFSNVECLLFSKARPTESLKSRQTLLKLSVSHGRYFRHLVTKIKSYRVVIITIKLPGSLVGVCQRFYNAVYVIFEFCAVILKFFNLGFYLAYAS